MSLAGYIVQDARAFTVDTRAPVTSITGALAPVPGAPRSALFAFAANDTAPAAFACCLNGSAWQTAPLPAALNATLGAWLPCMSPQVPCARVTSVLTCAMQLCDPCETLGELLLSAEE